VNNVFEVSNLTGSGNYIFSTSSPKEKRFIDPSYFLNSDAQLSLIYKKSSALSLQNNSIEIEMRGKRVINILYLFQEIKSIDNHKPFDCGFKNMLLIGERKLGLKSIFSSKCCMCNVRKNYIIRKIRSYGYKYFGINWCIEYWMWFQSITRNNVCNGKNDFKSENVLE
jgi:hypothetical protein